jgi:hypothetical protein
MRIGKGKEKVKGWWGWESATTNSKAILWVEREIERERVCVCGNILKLVGFLCLCSCGGGCYQKMKNSSSFLKGHLFVFLMWVVPVIPM